MLTLYDMDRMTETHARTFGAYLAPGPVTSSKEERMKSAFHRSTAQHISLREFLRSHDRLRRSGRDESEPSNPRKLVDANH
jgi:hypothetical protein